MMVTVALAVAAALVTAVVVVVDKKETFKE